MTGDEKWIHYGNPKHRSDHEVSLNISGKAKYPWFKAFALHLVESAGWSLLWATQTDQNHLRRSLSTTIDVFEPSIEEKMATIQAETWQSDFAT